MTRLIPDTFYDPDCKVIFSGCQALHAADHELNALTLRIWLEEHHKAADHVLDELAIILKDALGAPENVREYVNIIKRYSRSRALMKIYQSASQALSERSISASGAHERVSNEAGKLFEDKSEQNEGGLKNYLTAMVDRVDAAFHAQTTVTGLETGLIDLDAFLGGLQNGDFIGVAGRPSMGKTALLQEFALHASIELKKNVVVYSAEMSGEALVSRLACMLGKIDSQKMRNGKFDEEDWPRFTSAISLLNESTMTVIDELPDGADWHVDSLCAHAKSLGRDNVDLILVDYLQLLDGEGENQTNRVGYISKRLKALGKSMGCPLVSAIQLSRNLESRADKRPIQSDLRDSGAIEQDLDVAVMVYRDEVYDPDTPHAGIAELLIRKNRNGPIGLVKAAWLGQYTLFENLDTRHDDAWSGPKKKGW